MFYGNTIPKYQKIDISIIEGLDEFNLAYNNFCQLSNSINVITENQIILEQGFFQKFVETVKTLWGKFITVVRNIIKKIKSFFTKSKSNEEAVKEIGEISKQIKNVNPEEVKKSSSSEKDDKIKELQAKIDKLERMADKDNESHKQAIDKLNNMIKQEKERADKAEKELNTPKEIDLSSLTCMILNKEVIDKADLMGQGLHDFEFWIKLDPKEIEDSYTRGGDYRSDKIIEEQKDTIDAMKYLAGLDIDKAVTSKSISDYNYTLGSDLDKNLQSIIKFADVLYLQSSKAEVISKRFEPEREAEAEIGKKQSEIDTITKMSGNEISQGAANYMLKLIRYNIDTILSWNRASLKLLALANKVITHNKKASEEIKNKLKIKI